MLSVRMRMKQLVTAALTIFVLSWALAVTPASASFTQEAHPDEDFFAMCAEGEDEMLREELKKNPFWSNARTPDGESCLHLASLGGSNKVTKLLMEYGADPNIRSTYEHGLRMTPLSFNVFYRHTDCIKTLLKNGAEINADFDTAYQRDRPVTVLDIAYRLNKDDTDLLNEIIPILLENGAKTYDELHGEKTDIMPNVDDADSQSSTGAENPTSGTTSLAQDIRRTDQTDTFPSEKTKSKGKANVRSAKEMIRNLGGKIRNLFRSKVQSNTKSTEL